MALLTMYEAVHPPPHTTDTHLMSCHTTVFTNTEMTFAWTNA
jgi:hypothetical protein